MPVKQIEKRNRTFQILFPSQRYGVPLRVLIWFDKHLRLHESAPAVPPPWVTPGGIHAGGGGGESEGGEDFAGIILEAAALQQPAEERGSGG